MGFISILEPVSQISTDRLSNIYDQVLVQNRPDPGGSTALVSMLQATAAPFLNTPAPNVDVTPLDVKNDLAQSTYTISHDYSAADTPESIISKQLASTQYLLLVGVGLVTPNSKTVQILLQSGSSKVYQKLDTRVVTLNGDTVGFLRTTQSWFSQDTFTIYGVSSTASVTETYSLIAFMAQPTQNSALSPQIAT